MPLKKSLILSFCLFFIAQTAFASTFSYVQGIKASETSGTGTYVVGTFGSSLTVGNYVVCVVSNDNTVAGETTGIADTDLNTYTKQVEKNSSLRQISLWIAPITTGGVGDAVTVTYNFTNSNNSAAVCQEWNTSSKTLTLDRIASSTATSVNLNSGTTAATTAANELIFGAFVWTGTTAATTTAFGGGYSNATSTLLSNVNQLIESKEVLSTGTQVATATISASRAWGGFVVTFSVSGGGGGTVTAPPATEILAGSSNFAGSCWFH